MLKETLTYVDYDGNERKEDFYFNLNQAEVAKMELSAEGGMQAKMNRLVASNDAGTIAQIVEDVILAAYGVKSPDGKRFIKSKELSEEFKQTEAFSQLYIRLITNPDEMAKFVNGIVPQKA